MALAAGPGNVSTGTALTSKGAENSEVFPLTSVAVAMMSSLNDRATGGVKVTVLKVPASDAVQDTEPRKVSPWLPVASAR